jgi:hypothetical protein
MPLEKRQDKSCGHVIYESGKSQRHEGKEAKFKSDIKKRRKEREELLVMLEQL